jgi:hypothetical protein
VSNHQVLLQTYIEHLRGKVEDKKEINHHGNAVTVQPAVAATPNTLSQLEVTIYTSMFSILPAMLGIA